MQQEVFRLLSADINRDDGLVLLMGVMSAEQRLGGFLLGLASETVSRTISRFARDGLLAIDRREVELLDPEGLKELVGH